MLETKTLKVKMPKELYETLPLVLTIGYGYEDVDDFVREAIRIRLMELPPMRELLRQRTDKKEDDSE